MSPGGDKSGKAFLPKGEEVVVPPSLAMVWGAIGLGLVLNLSPWPDGLRWLVPDFALMVLLYWSVRMPRLAGLGVAFILGLVVDVERGMHLGLNALAFTTAAFVVLSVRRRLEKFGLLGQTLQLAPVFLGKEALVLTLGLWFGHGESDWRWLAGGGMAILVWPGLAWVLDRLTGRPAGPAE